jgi:acyl-CoA thioester hydrolase
VKTPASTSVVRVRYAETDRMGVVYYANYLVWFEVARADLMRTLSRTYRDLEEAGVILPVIEAHCEYRQPARYDEEIEIRATGKVLSAVRVKFTYEVLRRADGEPLATGHTVHAAVQPGGKPVRLPPELRKAFA